MPTSRANNAANEIHRLEKQLAKLQQSAQKARKKQISQLEKTKQSLSKKLDQAKTRLKNYKPKKTPASLRQKENLKGKILSLKNDLSANKAALMAAKAALKDASALEKAANQAQREFIAKIKTKNKKQRGAAKLKKQSVKKSIQASIKLTPDLSIPVSAEGDKSKKKKNKTTKKVWKPADKTAVNETSKTQATTTKPLSDSTQQIKTGEKSTLPHNDDTSKKLLAATLPKQQDKTDPASEVILDTNKNETNTAKKELESKNEKIAPSEKAETQDLKKENKEVIAKPITNWHTMPLLKEKDD